MSIIGKDLGRYHILEQLGEGGMATVYKAFDTRLETDVAVKIIRTDQFTPAVLARALKRFEREAKALAKLTHPNIVKVMDYGEYEGQPYLVMPFLPGGNLKQYQREHRSLPWQEAVRILLPIAQALEFAHSQGIIHRDVKPANILLTQNGQPMLTDFGVAKVIEEEATVDLTGTAAAIGTPEYMAPEQTGKNIDHRVDIYALGIVLFEMLTGRRPFEADTPLAVLVKHASEPLPRPAQFVPGLPEAVEKVLIKMLAKRPEDRYQTMDEVGKAFEGLLQWKTPGAMKGIAGAPKPRGKVESNEKETRAAPPLGSGKAPPRRWLAIAGGIAFLVLLLTVVVLLVIKPGALSSKEAKLPLPTETPAAISPISSPVPESVNITIWDNSDPDAVSDIFRQYEAAHPDVTITISKQNDLSASLAAAIPAGKGPDIIIWPNNLIGANARDDRIVALDNYGITQNWLADTFEPAAAAGVQWNGKIWGLPESQEAIAFIYNKALVTSEYLPTDPTSLADIAAKAKKFYEDKGMPLFCNEGFMGSNAYAIAPFLFASGVPTYVDDTGKVYLNTPEALAGFQWMRDLKPYVFQDADYNACNTAFTEGRVGAWNTGPWAIAGIEQAGISYGVLPFGKPMVSVRVLTISRNAVDRGIAVVALDIIKYFTSADIQKQAALAIQTVPANTAALKDPEIQALPTLAGFGASAALGVPIPTTPYMGAVWIPLGEAASAIWNDSWTPTNALNFAQATIEEAIRTTK